MNRTIRVANSGDIPDIQRLYRQLDDHHADLIPEVFQPLDWNARADRDIQEAIDREDMEYLVAICDEKVVGFVQLEIAIQPDFPVFRPREYALMDSAVVDKPYRRKGIGRILCKAAVEWCRTRGNPQIQTNVWDKNVGAREFYLDFGFRPMCVKLELNIGDISKRGGRRG